MPFGGCAWGAGEVVGAGSRVCSRCPPSQEHWTGLGFIVSVLAQEGGETAIEVTECAPRCFCWLHKPVCAGMFLWQICTQCVWAGAGGVCGNVIATERLWRVLSRVSSDRKGVEDN